MADDDLLAKAKEQFRLCSEDPADNRRSYEDDTRFVRLRDQWPEDIKKLRAGRPMLTIDKLGPVIRQVVNDARQNKPQIKVHPVDSGADRKTADVLDGLIRNIEYSSNADVAYDTAVECAVGGNVGYIRVKADYAFDDSFDMDLAIDRIANPMCVFGDPNSTAADSSDWNVAFITNPLTKEDYERQYGEKTPKIDWEDPAWEGWVSDDGVMVAEWWTREEYTKTIVQTADGHVYDKDQIVGEKADADLAALMAAGVLQIVGERETTCYRVTQRILSGAAVLETNEWPGRYIPIIPVYGDEFWIDGKRYLRSLVNGAIQAQQMFNAMRSTAVELWALSPKAPWIGPKGFANTDPRWETANQVGHPYLEYDGATPPIRTMIDPGVATGAMNEALAASDDIKNITGIHDASLGIKSNETSGRAIMARQREGDVSTFHFIDNLRRAIRHTGRILVDLIPHFYSKARIIRVIGEDGKESAVPVNQPFQQQDPMGQIIEAIHDLTTGKYDVTVTSGPSFTTRREEAAYSMTEALRAFPQAAPVIVPELAKNLDWPGADKIAEKLEQQSSGQLPPEVQKLVEAGKQRIAQLEQENQQLKADQQTKLQTAQMDAAVQEQAAHIDAQTEIIIANIKAAAQKEIAAMNARAQAMRPVVQPAPRQAA